ncbi:MAG: rhodanese-like domain-containing protein [Anaerolineales bacterium]|nr:rhodanese-like domain-containing protein [Anaerolineales bacterium]
MKRYVAVILLLVGLFLLAACQPGGTSISGKQVEVQGGTYTEISVDELHLMLKNKEFTLVNVHVPFEGDIPNTDVSIPHDQIAQNLDMLPADKNAEIVIYCRSDRMSTIASETLVGLGYTNVYNLDGGMVAWENAGLEIERQHGRNKRTRRSSTKKITRDHDKHTVLGNATGGRCHADYRLAQWLLRASFG